jgi:hypothetical protein
MKLLDFEKVSVADGRQVLEGEPVRAGVPEVTRRRTPQSGCVLLEATAAWIATLPEAVRPVELARRFPRIANSIGQLWGRAAPCEDYLESLVVDRRGNRTGFPPAVAREIAALHAYFAELHLVNRAGRDLVERVR